jgi:glycerol-3-phosphate cytidylyltransferase
MSIFERDLPLTLYTGGTFDLFHAGHVNFLKMCKNIVGEDGEVIVSLNTDEFIKEYKKQPPIVSYSDRAEVLAACIYVDTVIPNSGGADSKISIMEVEPDIIAIGSDWARKDYYKQMQFDQDWLDSKGISLIYIPYTKGISSSLIKTRL